MPTNPLPCLYTPQEIRDLGQANSVPNWDTMSLRQLGWYLWNNNIITQAILDQRQLELVNTMYPWYYTG